MSGKKQEVVAHYSSSTVPQRVLFLFIAAVLLELAFHEPKNRFSIFTPASVEAFSAAPRSSNSHDEYPETSSTYQNNPTSGSFFSTFQFTSNGVCVQPRYFFSENDDNIPQNTASSASSYNINRNIHHGHYFTMRNVPGEGDCMFLAVALAAATSMGLGGNDSLLRAISRETRNVVAQILESPTGTLYIGNGVTVTARDLLQSATKQEGLSSPQDYLQLLRLEGRMGGLYGGGPELAVLANVLRRPISIYELAAVQNSTTSIGSVCCPIVCRGTFGDGLFEDPCANIPHSALFSPSVEVEEGPYTTGGIPEGAYSWHLHILVLDVAKGEKHACVLLPSKGPTTESITT